LKKTFLKLAIPTPCTENWENMTPNERGRHCASCNKTVIDFSLYTDKQLIEFFSKVTGNICGRIPAFQLQRQLVYTEPQNHFLHKLLLGSALTLGLAGSANANYNPNQKPLIEHYLAQNENANATKPLSGGDTTHYIKGRLLNTANGHEIPNAFISIKGLTEFAKTDSLGYFKLIVPAEYIIPEITIVVKVEDNTATETNVTVSGKSFPIIKTIWVYHDLSIPVAGNIIPSTYIDPTKKKK
jgi:hypothetical protein